MSTVLLDFVAPYTVTAESEEQFRMAINVGVLAWNIALLEPDVQKEELDRLTDQAVRSGPSHSS